jgi:hypothetical protein
MKIARACRFPAADQPGDFVRTQQARCPVMRALGVRYGIDRQSPSRHTPKLEAHGAG